METKKELKEEEISGQVTDAEIENTLHVLAEIFYQTYLKSSKEEAQVITMPHRKKKQNKAA